MALVPPVMLRGATVTPEKKKKKESVLAKMSSFKQLDIANKTRGSSSANYVMGNPIDFIYTSASALP